MTWCLPDLFITAISISFLFSSSPSSVRPHFPKFPSISFQANPRRFLKFLSMNQSNNFHFANPQSLSDWLKLRLPSDSLASWGIKPGTKNVQNLWLELAEGETSLADSSPPLRTLNVVTVRILGKDDKVLVESHQELSDGSVRKRCRSLSEKMKPYETPEEAVIRAIKEEIGSIFGGSNVHDVVEILPGTYQKKVEERNSVSYPGLPARYVLHSVDARVDGLPEAEFCTEEADEYPNRQETNAADEAVSVKRHYWKWVSSDSI
ncbi:putative RING-H2 zinc finger protein RHA2a [Tripterygium wilfordii]|uniref:Putative RING-H2 zinc finger protein RHA2a n=1 Tax=Tripterygium wilfordii TaxID=458696 RepID=A0A7J7CEZ8_TRIWF|nr:uncharacterized protein LOC119983510 [Tripterygium wilfordii]KAF5732457.1 putative RING-H2 zinc finger protein RHA2a [Tripterygium wilfordii]